MRRQNATDRRTVGAWSGVFGDADERHPPIRRGHQLGDQRHRALSIWRRIESDHDPSHTSRPLSDHQDGALGASHDAARHAAHQQPLRGAMTAPAHCNQVSAKSLRFVENSFDGSLIDNTSFRTRTAQCAPARRPRLRSDRAPTEESNDYTERDSASRRQLERVSQQAMAPRGLSQAPPVPVKIHRSPPRCEIRLLVLSLRTNQSNDRTIGADCGGHAP